MTDLPKRELPNGIIDVRQDKQVENDDDWPGELIDRLDAWTARKLREQLLEEGKKR